MHVLTQFQCANHHFLCLDHCENERSKLVGGIFLLKTGFRQDVREVVLWCVSERVRRATARRMRYSRADSSIIKLPSQSSITLQGSRRPWRYRRWAGVQTHTYTQEHTNTMAGDHFAITLLGDFQLSLADLLQLFNQIKLMAAAKKHGGQTTGLWELTMWLWTIHTHDHVSSLSHVHKHSLINTPWQICTHLDKSFLSQIWFLSHLSSNASCGDVRITAQTTVLSRAWIRCITCTKLRWWKGTFQG